MCGLSGQLNFDGRPVDRGLVRSMTALMSHRGPDGSGFYFDRFLGLGHRRLAIIDVEGGAQPIVDRPSRLAVVANNEIYNYVELRRELQANGHTFTTASDTEVILRLFAQEAERCFARLEGMFAIAIWDGVTDTLWLARDPFGVKPLYFAAGATSLTFASELRPLLRNPSVDRSLDLTSVDAYFATLAVPDPRSIFRNIQKVPPGHYLRIRGRRTTSGRYWDSRAIVAGRRRRPKEGAPKAGELKERLQQSVALSLRSDVPVGILMSGGLDSSSVAVLAAAATDQSIHGFTAVFDERQFDERHAARLVAAAAGIRLHEVVVRPRAAARVAARLAATVDEPFADSSSIPMSIVCELASRHVKAVLSGEGADELFGGYPWHSTTNADSHEHPARVVFRRADRLRLFSRRWRQAIARARLRGPHHIRARRNVSILSMTLLDDLAGYLPSDILFKSDRISMQQSLEVRLPFLNQSFARWALTLDDACRVRERSRKHLLRRAMARLLPPSTLRQPKQGFAVPMDLWLWQKGEWRDLVYDTIFSRRARERDQFDLSVIQRLQQEHDRMQCMHGYRLWAIFIFESWQRAFVD